MNHIKNSFSTHQSPPKELLSSLLEHYQNGRFEEVENLAVSITQNFPKHQFAWKVLGAVLRATGRNSAALDANQTAVELSPQAVSYTHLSCRRRLRCRSRWSPYH